jgi:hypothetical protein
VTYSAFWGVAAMMIVTGWVIVFSVPPTLDQGSPWEQTAGALFAIGGLLLVLALPLYVRMVTFAYKLQRSLYSAGASNFQPWRLLVGAVILNPWVVGVLIGLGPLLEFRRLKAKVRILAVGALLAIVAANCAHSNPITPSAAQGRQSCNLVPQGNIRGETEQRL